MKHLKSSLKALSWTLYDCTWSFLLCCSIPSLPIYFSCTVFPYTEAVQGKGTSETRLLPGKERPVAGSQGGEPSHGLLSAQNHSGLLSPSPGHWPKWNCRSESLHKACSGYRCGNTLSLECHMWRFAVGPNVGMGIR